MVSLHSKTLLGTGTIFTLFNEMKKTHTVGTVQQSNRKIVGRGKIDTLTHIFITAQCTGLEQALDQKVAGLD